MIAGCPFACCALEQACLGAMLRLKSKMQVLRHHCSSSEIPAISRFSSKTISWISSRNSKLDFPMQSYQVCRLIRKIRLILSAIAKGHLGWHLLLQRRDLASTCTMIFSEVLFREFPVKIVRHCPNSVYQILVSAFTGLKFGI